MQIICNGEEWRTKRVKKALLIACDILGITEQQADVLIEKVYDDKGVLCVHWMHQRTPRQVEAFSTAWGLCKEDKKAVIHLMPKGLLGGVE